MLGLWEADMIHSTGESHLTHILQSTDPQHHSLNPLIPSFIPPITQIYQSLFKWWSRWMTLLPKNHLIWGKSPQYIPCSITGWMPNILLPCSIYPASSQHGCIMFYFPLNDTLFHHRVDSQCCTSFQLKPCSITGWILNILLPSSWYPVPSQGGFSTFYFLPADTLCHHRVDSQHSTPFQLIPCSITGWILNILLPSSWYPAPSQGGFSTFYFLPADTLLHHRVDSQHSTPFQLIPCSITGWILNILLPSLWYPAPSQGGCIMSYFPVLDTLLLNRVDA